MDSTRWFRCLKNYQIISKVHCANQRKRKAPTCKGCAKLKEQFAKSGAKLVTYDCLECGNPFQATYQSNRPAKYCPECRLKTQGARTRAAWDKKRGRPKLVKKPELELEVPCGVIVQGETEDRCDLKGKCQHYDDCLDKAEYWPGFKNERRENERTIF